MWSNAIKCVRPQCSSSSLTQGECLCLVSVSLAHCALRPSGYSWGLNGRKHTHSQMHTLKQIFFLLPSLIISHHFSAFSYSDFSISFPSLPLSCCIPPNECLSVHTHRTRETCNISRIYTLTAPPLSLPLTHTHTHTHTHSESVKHWEEVYSDCGQMSPLGIRRHQSCCQYRTAEPSILPTRKGIVSVCLLHKVCVFVCFRLFECLCWG